MHNDETLPEDTFPIRYVGYTTAFRREAGTYGKDMEGIFRLHQFDKLEMESFTTQKIGLNGSIYLWLRFKNILRPNLDCRIKSY